MGEGKKDEPTKKGEPAEADRSLPPREVPARPAPAPDGDRH